ncbi:MAG: SWIM zinc finger family protein [Candidatus Hadarchaeales archaeon]
MHKKDGTIYRVTYDPVGCRWACTCPDYTFRTKGVIPCKHIMMVNIAESFGLTSQHALIPDGGEPEPTALAPLSPRELVGKVVAKEDFVTIGGKVEITRSLALKLAALAQLSATSELLHFDADRAVVRVRLATLQGRTVEALGACDRDELPPEDRRSVHDVISRAETRAFKRALELAIGLPFINELIAQLFPQPQTNQARPQPQASTQAQKKVTDGPTAFWSKARARGLSREKAMEIIRQHTTHDGQTDWARAIEELETLK